MSSSEIRELARDRLFVGLYEEIPWVLLLSNQSPRSFYIEEDADELVAGWAI